MTLHFSNSALGRFRFIGIAEGISFLVLLLIAMPLKYFAGQPHAVLIVGWIHGALFISYVLALFNVWIKYKWSLGRVTVAFAVSLIPFGTFVADARLRDEEKILSA